MGALQWALGMLGAILVAVSHVESLTWTTAIAAVGGAILGNLKTGPNQISLTQLPAEFAEFMRRGGSKSDPPPPLPDGVQPDLGDE